MRKRAKNPCQEYVQVWFLFVNYAEIRFRPCCNTEYRQKKQADTSKDRQCKECKEIKPIQAKEMCL
jgi:hypothetical protein